MGLSDQVIALNNIDILNDITSYDVAHLLSVKETLAVTFDLCQEVRANNQPELIPNKLLRAVCIYLTYQHRDADLADTYATLYFERMKTETNLQLAEAYSILVAAKVMKNSFKDITFIETGLALYGKEETLSLTHQYEKAKLQRFLGMLYHRQAFAFDKNNPKEAYALRKKAKEEIERSTDSLTTFGSLDDPELAESLHIFAVVLAKQAEPQLTVSTGAAKHFYDEASTALAVARDMIESINRTNNTVHFMTYIIQQTTARLDTQFNNPISALKTLEPLVKKVDHTDIDKAKSWHLLGEAYDRLKLFTAAAKAYNKALKLKEKLKFSVNDDVYKVSLNGFTQAQENALNHIEQEAATLNKQFTYVFNKPETLATSETFLNAAIAFFFMHEFKTFGAELPSVIQLSNKLAEYYFYHRKNVPEANAYLTFTIDAAQQSTVSMREFTHLGDFKTKISNAFVKLDELKKAEKAYQEAQAVFEDTWNAWRKASAYKAKPAALETVLMIVAANLKSEYGLQYDRLACIQKASAFLDLAHEMIQLHIGEENCPAEWKQYQKLKEVCTKLVLATRSADQTTQPLRFKVAMTTTSSPASEKGKRLSL